MGLPLKQERLVGSAGRNTRAGCKDHTEEVMAAIGGARRSLRGKNDQEKTGAAALTEKTGAATTTAKKSPPENPGADAFRRILSKYEANMDCA